MPIVEGVLINIIRLFLIDGIGSDIDDTHCMITFKLLRKWFIKNKYGYIGNNSDLRAFVIIVGGIEEEASFMAGASYEGGHNY